MAIQDSDLFLVNRLGYPTTDIQAGPITSVTTDEYHIPYGRHFDFASSADGTSKSALIRDTKAFEVNEFTLSAWFYLYPELTSTSSTWFAYFYTESIDSKNRCGFWYNVNSNSFEFSYRGINFSFPITIEKERWYHAVFQINGDQGTVYVDGLSLGTQNVSEAIKYLGLGYPGHINGGHRSSGTSYARYKLAELCVISDRVIDPSVFGYRTSNGEWVSKPSEQVVRALDGDFGANGFYLDFNPNTGNGELADKSGNGNDFTEEFPSSPTLQVLAPDTPGQAAVTRLGVDPSSSVTAFETEDAVEEIGNGDDGRGTVAYVDVENNALFLDKEEPNWDVGSYIKGPAKEDTSRPPTQQTSHHVRADELEAKMGDNDLMLVNRESSGVYTSYRANKAQVFGELNDTDHLLVNRNNASFHCTGADFSDYFTSDTIQCARSDWYSWEGYENEITNRGDACSIWDGNPNTAGYLSPGSNTYITVTFTPALQVNNRTFVVRQDSDMNENMDWMIDGSYVRIPTVSGAVDEYTLPVGSTLTTLGVKRSTSGAGTGYIYGFKINGTYITEANKGII